MEAKLNALRVSDLRKIASDAKLAGRSKKTKKAELVQFLMENLSTRELNKTLRKSPKPKKKKRISPQQSKLLREELKNRSVRDLRKVARALGVKTNLNKDPLINKLLQSVDEKQLRAEVKKYPLLKTSTPRKTKKTKKIVAKEETLEKIMDTMKGFVDDIIVRSNDFELSNEFRALTTINAFTVLLEQMLWAGWLPYEPVIDTLDYLAAGKTLDTKYSDPFKGRAYNDFIHGIPDPEELNDFKWKQILGYSTSLHFYSLHWRKFWKAFEPSLREFVEELTESQRIEMLEFIQGWTRVAKDRYLNIPVESAAEVRESFPARMTPGLIFSPSERDVFHAVKDVVKGVEWLRKEFREDYMTNRMRVSFLAFILDLFGSRGKKRTPTIYAFPGNEKTDVGVSVETVNRRLRDGTATALLMYALPEEEKDQIDPDAIQQFMENLEVPLTDELKHIHMSYLKFFHRIFIRLGAIMAWMDPVRTRIRNDILNRTYPLFLKRS